MFSKAGPYLKSPEVTNSPNVIPKRYKLKKSKTNEGPKANMETPKKGAARSTAGIIPINVLNKAVAVSAVIISNFQRSNKQVGKISAPYFFKK